MKRAAMMMAFVSLSGCGRAAALPLDENDPVQCMVALAFASHAFNQAKNPQLASRMMSRVEAELDRAVASGRDREEVLADSRKVNKQMAGVPQQKVDELVVACIRRQDSRN